MDRIRPLPMTYHTYMLIQHYVDLVNDEQQTSRKITPEELVRFCVCQLFSVDDIPKLWSATLEEPGAPPLFKSFFV